MFEKGLLVLIKLLAGFLISAILLTAIPGEASTIKQRTQGEVLITGDYQVLISFTLDEQQPDRIGAVILKVQSAEDLDPGAAVQISLDEGDSWNKCTFSSGRIWKCVFQPGDAPMVEKIDRVKVVIKT